MNPFTKIVQPTYCQTATRYVPVFVKIEWDGTRLSITGVEGPKGDGDAHGSCGQIKLDPDERRSAGWTPELVVKLAETWERWHLNDMRAGCEHQRAEGWGRASLEIVTYELTTEGVQLRQKAMKRVAVAAANGETPEMSDVERALLRNEEWFKPIYAPLPADHPLAALYEEKSRETKLSCWVNPHVHPQGVLTKPCSTCGYQYGTEWLHEDVPEDVLAFLVGLPETALKPAWV